MGTKVKPEQREILRTDLLGRRGPGILMAVQIFAIFCPPLAVLLCGKPGQALLNVMLTLCFWIPGVIHAQWVVNNAPVEKGSRKTAGDLRQYRINSIIKKA